LGASWARSDCSPLPDNPTLDTSNVTAFLVHLEDPRSESGPSATLASCVIEILLLAGVATGHSQSLRAPPNATGAALHSLGDSSQWARSMGFGLHRPSRPMTLRELGQIEMTHQVRSLATRVSPRAEVADVA